MANKPKKPATLRLIPAGKKLSEVAGIVDLHSTLLSSMFVVLMAKHPTLREDVLVILRTGLSNEELASSLTVEMRDAYAKAIELLEKLSG